MEQYFLMWAMRDGVTSFTFLRQGKIITICRYFRYLTEHNTTALIPGKLLRIIYKLYRFLSGPY